MNICKNKNRAFTRQNFGRQNLGGFTLIELLVVIAVIGMLSSIVLVSMKGAREKAKIAKGLEFSHSIQHVLGSEAVGIWTFDDCPAGTANDSSGYRNNGTIYGASCTSDTPHAIVGTGTGKYALSFDGVDDYVNLGNPPSLQITGNQTIEMWLYPYSFGARRNPYSKAYGGEGTITQETNGTVNYYYGTCGGNCSPYQGFTMTSSINVNEWTHLVLVRDLTNMKLGWYKNGKKTNEVNASYSSATPSNLNAYIGKGYVSNYHGLIDEVRIYSQALTAMEIQKHYVEGLKTHQDLAKK